MEVIRSSLGTVALDRLGLLSGLSSLELEFVFPGVFVGLRVLHPFSFFSEKVCSQAFMALHASHEGTAPIVYENISSPTAPKLLAW